jgi:hypothetical protein
MRAASTTGASGLGAVTEGEHKLLQASIAALDQSQSPEQFKANLKRVRSTYEWIVNRTDANQPPPFSLRQDPSQSTGGTASAGAGGRTFIRDASGRSCHNIVNFEGQQHTFPTTPPTRKSRLRLPCQKLLHDAPMTAAGAYKAVDVGLQEVLRGWHRCRARWAPWRTGHQGAANWVSRKLGCQKIPRSRKQRVVEPDLRGALATIQTLGTFRANPRHRTWARISPHAVGFALNAGLGAGQLRGVVAPLPAGEADN